MSALALSLLLAVAASPSTTDATLVAPKVTRVFVMPLKGQGVEAAVLEQATVLVAQPFAGRADYAVLTSADVEKMLSLDQTRTMMGCGDQSCLSELSKGLNVDRLITGNIGRVGSRLTVGLVLLDPRTATNVNAVATEVDGPKGLFTALPTLVAQLMSWDGPLESPFRLPPGSKTTLAVMDLAPNGVGENVAVSLTQVLSAELKRVDGVGVISRDDIRALLQLQEEKTRAGCESLECLAEIGGALGVEKIVTGSVGKLADSYLIVLRLISARHSRVENLVSEAFVGSEDQLIRALKRAGRRLLGVDIDEKGTLAIAASEQGATVILDGVRRGTLPMPPLKELSAGPHTLQVVKSGYLDWSSDVYVEPQDTVAVWVQLVDRPLAWYQRWWVWTIIGTSGAAATAVLVVAVGASVAGAAAAIRYFQANSRPGGVTIE
ncbi:MAG: PEGA domain-containing protein [Myxococcota bacterium]